MSAIKPSNKVAAQHAPDPSLIDALDTLLAARFSCRGFLPQPVPRDIIEHMLTTAARTASWCNSQPWEIIVTSGAATERFRAAMMKAASSSDNSATDFPYPRDYTGIRKERRREVAFQLYDAVGVTRGDRVASAKQAFENFKFFGAPHAAIITTPEELGVYGAVDCGGYINALGLAAQALGLGLIAQAALAKYPDLIRKHFHIAGDRRVVCGLSFGYPDHAHPANSFRTRRAPLADMATFVDE